MTTIDQLWDNILSRDPILIKKTYEESNKIERKAIRSHLIKMSSEPGWHIEQIKSAEAAIKIIAEIDPLTEQNSL